MSKRKNKIKKPHKKKIGAFYKVNFFIILIASILLFYFMVLVSMGPKSFPLLTQKIEERVVADFGEGASINSSTIRFTPYGSFKIVVGGLNIFYSKQEKERREYFTIPRLEAEFSLVNLLFLNFQPTKIKIVRPLIIINDIKHFKSLKKESLAEEGQISAVISILSAIRSGENPIKNLEIIDAKFVVFSKGVKTDILLKRSQIKASKDGDFLRIFSDNRVNFNAAKHDVNLDSDCQFSHENGFRCDLFLENFSPDSISNIHPSLANFEKISAVFDSTISFGVKNGEFSNIAFKVKSDAGKFRFLDFFTQDISFRNFSIVGEYDHELRSLNFSSIESDLTNRILGQIPHLSMSMEFSDIFAPQKTSKFHVKLQDIFTDDLDILWPISLGKESVRSWVVSSLKDGVIKSVDSKFSLNHGEKTTLNDLDSELVLAGVGINYSPDFPKISNVSAVANFSKNSMKITISEGDVLGSKIFKTLVEIRDFFAEKIILNISGKLQGNAGDGLKHASNNPKFTSSVEKYLNGVAKSEFDIALNLSDGVTLKNSYILTESLMTDLNNEFARGSMLIKSKKAFGSSSFKIEADLTPTKITAKEFDILKNANVASRLNFIVDVGREGQISFNKIALTEDKNRSKLTGKINISTAPFVVNDLLLKNKNFGKNNFTLTYSQQKNLKRLFIKGYQFNLGSLIEGKFFQRLHGGNERSDLKVRIYLPQVVLMKGEILSSFSLALDCKKGLCFSGLAEGYFAKDESIQLNIFKEKEKNYSIIKGKISNIGHLAEGFGISNVVSGGNAKIEIKNTAVNNRAVFEGEVKVDKDITIYETATVKRLARDDLFSKIKDKVFSSEKTTFNSVKIKFDFKDRVLKLESLVANNYKIGITAKGFLNIKESTYQIKGMIVPGFLVNNLFGIGNLPVIGGVISGILTGGEGGGVFGIRYEYSKNKTDHEGRFFTKPVTSFVPSTIQNLFDF